MVPVAVAGFDAVVGGVGAGVPPTSCLQRVHLGELGRGGVCGDHDCADVDGFGDDQPGDDGEHGGLPAPSPPAADRSVHQYCHECDDGDLPAEVATESRDEGVLQTLRRIGAATGAGDLGQLRRGGDVREPQPRRTGPTKVVVMGSCWPKRSSSAGPDQLSDGAATPTCTVCPAADTCCIGVTSSATVIETAATAMTSPPSVPSRRSRPHREVRPAGCEPLGSSSTLSLAIVIVDEADRSGRSSDQVDE